MTAATPAAPAAPPGVAALITKLGCKGGPIGTQLYSRETGRCMLGNAEITIATFTTNALRDQWVDFGSQYGGTFVIGDRWAAGAETPGAAAATADKLGGKLVT